MRAVFLEKAGLSARFSDTDGMQAAFGEVQRVASHDVYAATTAEWDAQQDLISEKGIVYIYTDYQTNSDGQNIPGFKIGDGLAYLIDLPFSDDLMLAHMENQSIHITDAEREFWNNKVTAYLNAMNTEELILTKD